MCIQIGLVLSLVKMFILPVHYCTLAYSSCIVSWLSWPVGIQTLAHLRIISFTSLPYSLTLVNQSVLLYLYVLFWLCKPALVWQCGEAGVRCACPVVLVC